VARWRLLPVKGGRLATRRVTDSPFDTLERTFDLLTTESR